MEKVRTNQQKIRTTPMSSHVPWPSHHISPSIFCSFQSDFDWATGRFQRPSKDHVFKAFNTGTLSTSAVKTAGVTWPKRGFGFCGVQLLNRTIFRKPTWQMENSPWMKMYFLLKKKGTFPADLRVTILWGEFLLHPSMSKSSVPILTL